MPLDRVDFLRAGSCSQWDFFAGGSPWRIARFPASFVHLHHPEHGGALIDTGYSSHFFSATRRFPARLYRWLTPVRLGRDEDARSVLASRGIEPDDIRRVFVSHFHGDHIAGLRLFPNARFVYRRAAHESLIRQDEWTQVRHAFVSGLLPDDFVERGEPIEESRFRPGSAPFHEFHTLDFWGDGSLVLVDLPGHAEGHTGYVLTTASERWFYIVDATWYVDVLLKGRTLPLPSRGVQSDYRQYADTQAKLRRLADASPSSAVPTLVACHCPQTLREVP